MVEFLFAHEAWIRMGSFLVLFFLFVTLESWRPFRPQAPQLISHYLKNLSLIAISSIVIRLGFPLIAVGAAGFAHDQRWGLLNYWQIDEGLNIFLTVILFDLLIYAQHRAFHSWSWLWPLHRVHHSETHFDASSGVRFHPLEIALSMILKIVAAVALGAHPAGIVIFEVVLNATSLFSHMNVALPERVDQMIRWIFVTPDMHRVHHSIQPAHLNSNFGFSLSFWDRALGTYRELPQATQKSMTIGVTGFSDEPLVGLLTQPLRRS